jgi:hypothetical protein
LPTGQALVHASSKVPVAQSMDALIAYNVLFSFWKGLELLKLHNPSAASSSSVREKFLATMLQLAQECECSNKSGNQFLCAQSFCLVAEMFPDSVFLDRESCDRPHANETVKQIALKLMQGCRKCYSRCFIFLTPSPRRCSSSECVPRSRIFLLASDKFSGGLIDRFARNDNRLCGCSNL